MKKRRGILFFLLIFLVLIFVSFGLLYRYRNELTDSLLEYLFNQNTKEFFGESVRLSGVHLEPNGHLFIDRFEGKLATQTGFIPIEIRQIQSETTVLHYFSMEGLRLNFKSLRPSYSSREGVDGVLQIRGNKEWFFDLKATVQGIDLEDMVIFNPDFLQGSKGRMKGTINLHASFNEEPKVSADLSIEKPGGKLQSQFFDGITPYLPKSLAKKQVKKLSHETELVDFDNANLRIDIARSDRIKVFLHILVPDYNLNLNLNMEIRVSDKEVLKELLQIIGVVQIKVGS